MDLSRFRCWLLAAGIAAGLLPSCNSSTQPNSDLAAVPDIEWPIELAPDLAGTTCGNGVRDGDEADMDCGGQVCPRCAAGRACPSDADCTSGSCKAHNCAVPSCNDMVKNGAETDVDCGGSCPNKCADGMRCSLSQDCQSGMCLGYHCATRQCPPYCD